MIMNCVMFEVQYHFCNTKCFSYANFTLSLPISFKFTYIFRRSLVEYNWNLSHLFRYSSGLHNINAFVRRGPVLYLLLMLGIFGYEDNSTVTESYVFDAQSKEIRRKQKSWVMTTMTVCSWSRKQLPITETSGLMDLKIKVSCSNQFSKTYVFQ